MPIINVNVQDTFNSWRVKTNEIGNFVGNTSNLETVSTNVVEAINELQDSIEARRLALQTSIDNVAALLLPIDTMIETVDNTSFKINVDSSDSAEFTLLSNGNLTLTGEITSTRFNGPLTGNVTGNVTGNLTGNITGDAGGNAATASKFLNARNISITGDGTWTVSLDGSANVTSALTLTATGVAAGTHTKVTVDAKGRVTTGGNIASSDVTTALGFTPLANDGKSVDSARLNGYLETAAATANTVMFRNADGNTYVNFLYGTAQYANYADLAEVYSMDKEYPVGTVIVVAAGGDSDCTQSWKAGQLALGVISEKPAYCMNSEAEGQPVALKGRVPVRVVGPIKKSDTIMAAPDGHAIVGETNIIGAALESNDDPGEKLVECAII